MRLCSIASGSSGNCIYVGSDTTHLLVDTGISGKRTELGLNEIELSGKNIDGILITHEHIDHISGLGVLSRKYSIPIYATEETVTAILKTNSVGTIDKDLFHIVKADTKFVIKDITINPMSISHDAADPVAYRFQHEKKKVAVITDLGYYTDYTVECMKGLDAVLIEANHDVNMLQVGPYPYYLKQRILGKRGHLSNEVAGKLLNEILHENIQHVLLGHLSKENNLAELAYETVRMEITMSDSPYRGDDFKIKVANRSCNTDMVMIK